MLNSNKLLTVASIATCALLAASIFCFSPKTSPVSAANQTPSAQIADDPSYSLVYSKDGDLTPPISQYRQWVYLTSGLDMSYTPKADANMSMFDNVFVNPEAWRSFQATGTWPDKTVLVLEVRGAKSKGSINKSGHFQNGDIMGMEIHVKDESRFPGKWVFFDVASPAKATLIPQGAPCYTCHQAHAAVDTTFVQFYPTLLPIAQKKATLSAAYLNETSKEETK